MSVIFRNALGAVFVAVLLLTPASAQTTAPAVHRIETFYATLVDAMRRGPQLGMKGRYQVLAPVIDATFDLPTMIKFIVGPGWTSMPETDHKALTDAFRRMTIANYASNFDKFNGEKFTVEPNVLTKGSDIFVQSNLVPSDGKPIPFNYRMRQAPDGTWKVIDVNLNGYVSELATRRSDFSATLASGGAPALVSKLNSLADDQLAGGKTTSGG